MKVSSYSERPEGRERFRERLEGMSFVSGVADGGTYLVAEERDPQASRGFALLTRKTGWVPVQISTFEKDGSLWRQVSWAPLDGVLE